MAKAKVAGSSCLAVLVFVISACLPLSNVAAQPGRLAANGDAFRRIQKNKASRKSVLDDQTLAQLANRDPAIVDAIVRNPPLGEELKRDPSRFDRTTGGFKRPNKGTCTRESENMKGDCSDDNACKDECTNENNSNFSGGCEAYEEKRELTGTLLNESKRCGCYYVC